MPWQGGDVSWRRRNSRLRNRCREREGQKLKLVAKPGSKCGSVVGHVTLWPFLLLLYPAEPCRLGSPHPHENDNPTV